jgi:DnaK suppressor protein
MIGCAASGRAYFHYWVPLWPSLMILCGLGLEWLIDRIRRQSTAIQLACGLALLLLCGQQAKKYYLFERSAFQANRSVDNVAHWIDRVTTASDDILPIGDVVSVDIALRAQRLPSTRFIYQLPMMHGANPEAAHQLSELKQQFRTQPPAVVFSAPGLLGNLCGATGPDAKFLAQQAKRDRYDGVALRRSVMPSYVSLINLSRMPPSAILVSISDATFYRVWTALNSPAVIRTSQDSNELHLIPELVMNLDHYKTELLKKERELTEELTRFKQNARDARTAEVEDPIDYVTSSETQAAAMQEGSIVSDTLDAVHDALARIEEGTYGTCIDCGRPIEPARLEAVPWTPYCRDDQEKHDRERKLSDAEQFEATS